MPALRVAPRRALRVPALRVAPRRALEPAVREVALVRVQALQEPALTARSGSASVRAASAPLAARAASVRPASVRGLRARPALDPPAAALALQAPVRPAWAPARVAAAWRASVSEPARATPRGLTGLQTASLLYNAGHKRAAKELLCEQREMYDAFRSVGAPCTVRADWELMRPRLLALTANAPMAFSASAYRSRADCLTAAYTARVPLSACDAR